MTKYKKILLIGPQGSGKSTQGKLLSEFLGIPYISTGDIFRKIASSNTEEGEKIKQILDSGNLVDDETTAQLVRKRIQEQDCMSGFILDGYPRNLEQSNKISDIDFDKVFYFKVPQDVAVERLLKRGRADDTEEAIRKRLDLYFKQTEALLENYKNKGILVEIDGVGDVDAIQKSLRANLLND